MEIPLEFLIHRIFGDNADLEICEKGSNSSSSFVSNSLWGLHFCVEPTQYCEVIIETIDWERELFFLFRWSSMVDKSIISDNLYAEYVKAIAHMSFQTIQRTQLISAFNNQAVESENRWSTLFPLALSLCSSIEAIVFRLLNKNRPNSLLRVALFDPLLRIDLDSENSKRGVILLKYLFLPTGMNLRNILWHGFLSPEDLDIDLVALLYVLHDTLKHYYYRHHNPLSTVVDSSSENSLKLYKVNCLNDFWSPAFVMFCKSFKDSEFMASVISTQAMLTTFLMEGCVFLGNQYSMNFSFQSQLRVMFDNCAILGDKGGRSFILISALQDLLVCRQLGRDNTIGKFNCISTALLKSIPIIEQALRILFSFCNIQQELNISSLLLLSNEGFPSAASSAFTPTEDSEGFHLRSDLSVDKICRFLFAQESEYYSTLDGFGQRSKHQLLLDPEITHCSDDFPSEGGPSKGGASTRSYLPLWLGPGIYSAFIDLFLAASGPNLRAIFAHGDILDIISSNYPSDVHSEALDCLEYLGDFFMGLILAIAFRFQISSRLGMQLTKPFMKHFMASARMTEKVASPASANLLQLYNNYSPHFHPTFNLVQTLRSCLKVLSSSLYRFVGTTVVIQPITDIGESIITEYVRLLVLPPTNITVYNFTPNFSSNLDSVESFDIFLMLEKKLGKSACDHEIIIDTFPDSIPAEIIDTQRVISLTDNSKYIEQVCRTSEFIGKAIPLEVHTVSILKIVFNMVVRLKEVQNRTGLSNEAINSYFDQMLVLLSFHDLDFRMSEPGQTSINLKNIGEILMWGEMLEGKLTLLHSRPFIGSSAWTKILETLEFMNKSYMEYLKMSIQLIDTNKAKSAQRRKFISFLLDGQAVVTALSVLSLSCLLRCLSRMCELETSEESEKMNCSFITRLLNSVDSFAACIPKVISLSSLSMEADRGLRKCSSQLLTMVSNKSWKLDFEAFLHPQRI